ncbi:MAG TPA: ATP synthase F0 subunit B [Candidatus Angelobacter sp.]|nr:ATP synthase F0 subunit B [Candidatus Angelobacter sp.]
MQHKTALRIALTSILWMLLPLTAVSVGLQAQESPAAQKSLPAESSSADSQLPRREVDKRESPRQAEEKSEEDEIRHSPVVRSIARMTGLSVEQTYWLCVLINFGIVLFAVLYALRKKLPSLFKSRTDAIQQHLEEARKTSEEARTRLTEVEARLSRLDSEIEGMRRQAEENARADDQRILAESEQERRRIVEAAELEINMAAGSARRDLQAYAAELAVDLARKKIRVGAETDQGIVSEFTSWLGKGGN